MKNHRIISVAIACFLLLSACSVSGSSKPTNTPVLPTSTSAITSANGPDIQTQSTITPVTGSDTVTETMPLTLTLELTPTVAETPTAVLTDTSGGDIVVNATTVKTLRTLVRLNLRNGPGVTYKVIANLPARRTMKVNGISSDKAWYRVVCLDGKEGNCWVSADKRYVTAMQ